MRLLSTAGSTDTVTVILREVVTDSRGHHVPQEVGRVLCRGMVHVSTQADVERYAGTGMAVQDMRRFVTREFPGDDVSQVILSDGVVYDVVGAPKRFRNSRMTSRDVVMLSATKQPRQWEGVHG